MRLKIERLSKKRLLLLIGGLALIVTVVTVVTALGLRSMDNPGKGISGSDAVQLAWEHSGQGAVTVRSAEIKRDFVTGFDLLLPSETITPWEEALEDGGSQLLHRDGKRMHLLG